MPTIRRQARTAGLVYFLMILLGAPGLLFTPGSIVVSGDPAATVAHLRGAETLFRLGLASQIVGQVGFLILGLALHRLLAPVHRTAANLMVALVWVSIPVTFVDTLNEIAALVIAGGPSFLGGFTKAQLDSLAYFFLRLYGEGIGIVWVFWGLWLAPFGWLVFRSKFLPKALGILLMLAAIGDLLRAVTSLFPVTRPIEPFAHVLGLGELPIVFWLLIVGARDTSRTAAPPLARRTST